jgi:hypothetical protein
MAHPQLGGALRRAALYAYASTIKFVGQNDFGSGTGNEGYETSATTGVGAVIEASTVEGTMTVWTANTALRLLGGSTVTLSKAAFTSWFGSAATVSEGSTLDLAEGTFTGAMLLAGADQKTAKPSDAEVIRVDGQSKLKLGVVGVANNGARVGIRVTGKSSAVLDRAQLSGSRSGDASQLNPAGRRFDGDFVGLWVDGEGSTAQVTGGRFQVQRADNIRVGAGGDVTVTGATLTLGEHNVRVTEGGKATLKNCTLDTHQTHAPAEYGAGLKVDAGGTAVADACTFASQPTAVWVAAKGACTITGGTIRNGTTGIRADPGATVTATGHQFRDVTTEVVGIVEKGKP